MNFARTSWRKSSDWSRFCEKRERLPSPYQSAYHPESPGGHWIVVREEAQGDMGLFRYRLTLRDGGLLELFERFQVKRERLQVVKYSFHWQGANGQLRKRWDNAAHHPEVSTRPHHVHDGTEANVLPHGPISAEEVLTIIAAEAAD